MVHFYKPNSKVTGTACSFWHNSKENTFFGSFIKQDSWNGKTKTGSFSKNKGNPKKEVIIKFSNVEIATFIDCIERDAEHSGYHQSQKQVVRFNFKKYMYNDERRGFSWGAVKEAKDDAVNKVNFIIGLSFGESMLLKEHLRFMLYDGWHLNALAFSRDDNYRKAAPTKTENTPSEEDPQIKFKKHNLGEDNLDEDDFDF